MLKSIQDPLLAALAKVDRPGTFCTSGELPTVLPGLEVAAFGQVPVPLTKRDAAKLKKLAQQAPYGKGTQTLVDTNVRRVWEIDAGQVTLTNPQWSGVVQQAVAAAQAALGLEQQRLEPHLYKLLLYETGSFFLPHQDGEKLDRMVATLVIALPAAHTGGELVVRHEGREQIVDFSSLGSFQTQFAAFYADCEHEIRPVTSGFRLALVYNLTVGKSQPAIAAPTSRQHVQTIAPLLQRWRQEELRAAANTAAPQSLKLAVLLDHQYTEAGLSRDALKGTDRARADVLFAAAREAGCEASLALVEYWESGSAEPTGYEYGYRRRRYGRYNDDDASEASEHVMGEVYDHSLVAHHFSDADGQLLAFGSIPLQETELVCKDPIKSAKPTKEDFEGYTGNAGMTLERWYHRAAIVLWPPEFKFDVLCAAGVHSAVGGLAQLVDRWREAREPERQALHASCLDFASRIIAHWPEKATPGYHTSPESPYNFALPSEKQTGAVRHYDDFADEDDEDDEYEDEYDDRDQDDDDLDYETPAGSQVEKAPVRSFLSLLDELGDVALIRFWIRQVLARDTALDPGSVLGDVLQLHGWTTFQQELQSLFAATTPATLERHARMLADFALRSNTTADRHALCRGLAQSLLAVVNRWDPKQEKLDWRMPRLRPHVLVPPLIQALLALQEEALLNQLVTLMLAHPLEFPLTAVQLPLLQRLTTWLRQYVQQRSSALERWLTTAQQELKSRAARPPLEPTDWRRPAETGCKCADCRALSKFLADPSQSTLRLPLAEQRRRHVHSIIQSKALDTTHVTERTGRPFTLVCKKTQGSYDRALVAHQLDLEHLSQIEDLLTWSQKLPGSPASTQKTAAEPKTKAKSAPKKMPPKRQ